MRKEQIENLNLYRFDSFEEYLQRASDPQFKRPNEIAWTSGYNTPIFEQALKHARHGWENSLEEIMKWANIVIDDISSQLPKPIEEFDKTGSSWELGRVIEGDPECWIHEEPAMEIDRPGKGNIVRMVINTAAQYNVFENSHRNRCGAIMALTHLLEKVGFYVQFEITTAIQTHKGKVEFRTTAKLPGEALNIGCISFWCSSDMERHIDFAICETIPECEVRKEKPTVTYKNGVQIIGKPQIEQDTHYGSAIFSHDPGDICFDRMHSHDCNWNDENSVRLYIKKQLALQGVKLSGDNLLPDNQKLLAAPATTSDDDWF